MLKYTTSGGGKNSSLGRWKEKQDRQTWSRQKDSKVVRKKSESRLILSRSAFNTAKGSSDSRLNRPGSVAISRHSPLVIRKLSFLSAQHFLEALAITAAVLFLAFMLARGNHQMLGLGYQVSNLTQERIALQEENRKLKMDLSSLTSLSKLETIAYEKLGLIKPESPHIVVIE